MNKQKTIKEKIVSFVIFLALFVLVLIVFITMFFSDESWGLWIAENKDLIIGIYAVGAAWVTVDQMRRTDSLQAERHRKLVLFTMRKEVMRIRRAYAPQVSELRKSIETIASFLKEFEKTDYSDPQRREAVRNPERFWRSVRTVAEILDREQILDVKELFDENALRSLQLAKDNLKTVLHFVNAWEDADDPARHNSYEWDMFSADWDENEYWYYKSIRDLCTNIDVISSQLEDMYVAYGGESQMVL